MPWFEGDAGNRLWYEDYGAGTPIIFIHGWCMSSAVWEFQREGLTDSFRVITLDLRGHGNSPPHADGFDIAGCAADVAGLIEFLGIYDTILVGWSLGALIAIEVSLRCSGRLSGLALISGTPRFVQTPDFPYGLSRMEVEGMAKKVQRNLRRALDGFFSRMFASGEEAAERVHTLLASVPMPPVDVAQQALEALVNADMCSCLGGINLPTLIMHGDRDVICLPQASEYMLTCIPMARQVVFFGCGHVPFLTQSREFNARLAEFRGRVSGGEYRQG